MQRNEFGLNVKSLTKEEEAKWEEVAKTPLRIKSSRKAPRDTTPKMLRQRRK